MKNYERELVEVALPFWEAEAEIVKRFFKRKPSRDDHIFWLRAQLWKELHPVDGYFSGLHRELSNLVEMFPRVDREISLQRVHMRNEMFKNPLAEDEIEDCLSKYCQKS